MRQAVLFEYAGSVLIIPLFDFYVKGRLGGEIIGIKILTKWGIYDIIVALYSGSVAFLL